MVDVFKSSTSLHFAPALVIFTQTGLSGRTPTFKGIICHIDLVIMSSLILSE